MQAARWPGRTSISGGATSAHAGITLGQRVRKWQPDGGVRGLGGSPTERTVVRPRPGTEANSASV
jgi:hypothetical protein